jgi:hypothetical protein
MGYNHGYGKTTGFCANYDGGDIIPGFSLPLREFFSVISNPSSPTEGA